MPHIDTAIPQNNTIESRVKRIIGLALDVDPDRVKDEARLLDDLGADSLDAVEMIMAMEEEFGVEISDAEAEDVMTVGDVVTLLKMKVR